MREECKGASGGRMERGQFPTVLGASSGALTECRSIEQHSLERVENELDDAGHNGEGDQAGERRDVEWRRLKKVVVVGE
jgi:hypothetical protein